MAPTAAAQRQREWRKRNRNDQFRMSDEFLQFLRDIRHSVRQLTTWKSLKRFYNYALQMRRHRRVLLNANENRANAKLAIKQNKKKSKKKIEK